jgi:hypothetical protein
MLFKEIAVACDKIWLIAESLISVSESSSCSSPSSSSSSDSDGEAASLSKGQLDLIKSDKNVCPDGCGQDLYNITLELRSQR